MLSAEHLRPRQERRRAAAGALEELHMAGEQQQELEEMVEMVRLEILVATIRLEVEENLLVEVMEDQQQEADHCYQQVNELTRQLQGDEASVHVVNADRLPPRPRTRSCRCCTRGQRCFETETVLLVPNFVFKFACISTPLV